jgi:formate dehydrogenase major subunit
VPDVMYSTDRPDTPNGKRAFHMNAEGVGRLFAAVYNDPDPRSPASRVTGATSRKMDRCPEMWRGVSASTSQFC